ncbi:MAG: beta/gamma crystallin-related protein [Casimicrobiaceae bacterium]
MNRMVRNLLLAAGLVAAGNAMGQATFFEHDGFHGRSFTTDRNVWNFERWDFNDRASSVSVRGGSWEVCSDARFEGRCVMLRPGDYPSLGAMGLNDRVSSVREVQHYGSGYDYGTSNPNPYARGAVQPYRGDVRDDYRDGWRYDRRDQRWERY